MSGMIGVDIGGTFTDVISTQDDGSIEAVKVPTNNENMELPVIEGAKQVGLKDKNVFNHASTAGLNAILTRKLPKIAFLTTQGHRDILDMGRAWRPLEGQTDANWRRSFGDATAPLVPRYLRRGILERIKSNGDILIPFDKEQAYKELEVLKKCNVQGVAICLINAYVNPEHEILLQQMVYEVLGDIPCSISSNTSPLAKEYARASTTVVDVFMKIIYDRYSDKLIRGLKEEGFKGDVNFADCAANLSPADFALEKPHKIVFSGPSAGTVSSAHFGSLIEEKNVVCCDIGGTSCDISIVKNGNPTVTTVFELEHDLLVNTLTNEVTSIGAGGGSTVKIDPGTGELQVGPESAGANPGPACYGNGGQVPTLTDACLMIGILNPNAPLGGRIHLKKELAETAFQSLKTNLDFDQRIQFAYKMGLSEIGEGIVDISVKHGIDPRDFSLIAYGSAGPMLLPAVMKEVGAKRVLIPPYPGLFSALGLLSSDRVFADSQSAYLTIDEKAVDKIERIYKGMEDRLLSKISQDKKDVKILRSFDGHLSGQTWETPFVPVPEELTKKNIGELVTNFHETYEKHWGNRFDGLPVVGVTFRLQIIIPTEKVNYPQLPTRMNGKVTPIDEVELKYIYDKPLMAKVYQREELCKDDVITGPAVIRDQLSTIFIEQSQIAKVGRFGEIAITQS